MIGLRYEKASKNGVIFRLKVLWQTLIEIPNLDFFIHTQEHSPWLARIERFPYSGPKRHPQAPGIRGLRVKNTQAEAGQAKRFPCLVVYRVKAKSPIIVAYQLWPMRSGTRVSDAP